MSNKMNFFGVKKKDGWDMYTITSDGINPQIYKNGNPLVLASTVITGTYVRMRYETGRTLLRYFQPYQQFIDELSFYNRFITENDVKELWNNGYGIFFNDLSITQKTGLERYLNMDYNNTDLVTNTDFLGYYRGYFSGEKKGGTYSISTIDYSTGSFYLGSNNYTSLDMSNSTTDTPYTYNFWMKNNMPNETLNIFKALWHYNQGLPIYNIQFSNIDIKLTYYSLGSGTNYKTFTFNL